MSEPGGTAAVKPRPRSKPLAVGLVLLVGIVVAVVIAALTKPSTDKAVTPVPSASASATEAPLPPGRTLSGVAGIGTDAASAFGVWRGRPVEVVVDYVGSKTWDGVTGVKREGLLDRGLPSSVHRVFSIPLIPTDDNATLAQGAAGDYDHYFRELAEQLIAGGQASATMRIGWEMTGTWFPWSGVQHPDQYVGAYRKAVTAMRSAKGADFTFDWGIAMGQVDPEPMYPGDDYVDLIGADNYDASFTVEPTDHVQVWNSILNEVGGLNWLGSFAAAHGKRISFGEWGVSDRQDGHGGGDDPYFVEQMHSWITSHDVAYEAYFESTDDSVQATFAIDNGHFPQAAERYKELFGGSGTSTGTSASTTTPGLLRPSS